MADSLRDQLLKSGIVKQVQQDRAREPKRPAPPPSGKPARKGGKPHAASHVARPSGQSQQDIDLAKAYALRAQTEARERQRVEREAAEQARLRRERKQKIERAFIALDIDDQRRLVLRALGADGRLPGLEG